MRRWTHHAILVLYATASLFPLAHGLVVQACDSPAAQACGVGPTIGASSWPDGAAAHDAAHCPACTLLAHGGLSGLAPLPAACFEACDPTHFRAPKRVPPAELRFLDGNHLARPPPSAS